MSDHATEVIDTSQLDSVVTSILNKFTHRAKFGKMKYGTDLDRTDLSTIQWIEHAQDELMDGILYLEKLKQHTRNPEANQSDFSK